MHPTATIRQVQPGGFDAGAHLGEVVVQRPIVDWPRGRLVRAVVMDRLPIGGGRLTSAQDLTEAICLPHCQVRGA
jgi:hypothetical protein